MSRSVLSTLDRAAGGLFPYSASLSAEVLEARATVERMAEALERMKELAESPHGEASVMDWAEAISAAGNCLRAYRGEQA